MSVNKAILVGNLGADPEIRDLGSDRKVANLRVATSESWKDRNTGERKEQTEWHTVSVFIPGLISVIEQYCKKGTKLYIEGQIKTRKYEKNGQDHYATEIVLQGPGSTFQMLSGNGEGGQPRSQGSSNQGGGQSNANQSGGTGFYDDADDDIPF